MKSIPLLPDNTQILGNIQPVLAPDIGLSVGD